MNKKKQRKKTFTLSYRTKLFVACSAFILIVLFIFTQPTNTQKNIDTDKPQNYTPVAASSEKTNTMHAQLTTSKDKKITVASWVQNGLLTLEVSGTLPPLEKDQEYRLWIRNGEKTAYAGKLVRNTATDWKGLFRLGSNFYSYNSLLLERVDKNTPRDAPSDNIVARGELKKKSQ